MSIKEFIQNNIELIDDEQWETLYNKCYYLERGKLTDVLLSAGINPFETLTYIPEYAFYQSQQSQFTIPDSVTFIGKSAFEDCNSLTDITIGDNITSIGRSAFWGCSSLTSVTISNSVASIGEWTFSMCTSLTSITIPDSVTSISASAFEYCDSLTSITIPDSVTKIGYGAFASCGDLEIMFNGTKEQWKNIYTINGFLNTYFTIHCSDGKIVKRKK